MGKRTDPKPVVKLRWLIILPIIAILILTIALMVKEYKDQKVRSLSEEVSYTSLQCHDLDRILV